ncbi:MAG TPA: hypothetical protein VF867_14305 [Arthrobacter sp.]
MNSRKLISAAGIAGALLFTSACSASVAAAPPAASSPSASATETAAQPSAIPVAAPASLPKGLIPKGVANDGKGVYLQTSIADTDPAMQYNPALSDDAAKAHFSAADLAEAQKVVVRFIAEEAIDSTLNDGTDVDGWWAAHVDQIHPVNQPIMLKDMHDPAKDILDRERWITARSGYSYLHGETTSRIKSRTITPKTIEYVEGNNLQGVTVSTTASWSMEVTGGSNTGRQMSTAEISFSVAKDPADGKWKIAGYDTNYHTAEG